jgi:hypothetical protein
LQYLHFSIFPNLVVLIIYSSILILPISFRVFGMCQKFSNIDSLFIEMDMDNKSEFILLNINDLQFSSTASNALVSVVVGLF